jgi:hypothetical protein
MADEDTGYTRGERAAGIFGLLLFVGLAVIAADLASGGRLFRRGGCGCDGKDEGTADGA